MAQAALGSRKVIVGRHEHAQLLKMLRLEVLVRISLNSPSAQTIGHFCRKSGESLFALVLLLVVIELTSSISVFERCASF